MINSKEAEGKTNESKEKIHKCLVIDEEKISIITHIPISEVQKSIETNNLHSLIEEINSKELSIAKQQKLNMLFELAKELNHE